MEHTKGEWKVQLHTNKGSSGVHYDVDIKTGEYEHTNIACGISEANAERIVKAVNCHDDLVEALELIYSKCRRLSTEEIIIVGKALAKAEAL